VTDEGLLGAAAPSVIAAGERFTARGALLWPRLE
jgi:hypothetical protein